MANNALALPADNPLIAMTQTETSVEAQISLPYVGFYSRRAEKAMEIASDCRNIQEGEPYLSTPSGSFKPVTSIGLIGPTFRYWAKLDNDYKVAEASVVDPGRGTALKEHVLAPILAYTAEGVTPTLSTFRPTKVKACLDLVNGVARGTDEACKEAGPIGKQLTNLPQPLRTVGEVEVLNKTSASSGFNYQLARCRTRLLSDVECESLGGALNDQEFNETCAAIQSSYDRRKEMITKVANGE